MPTTSHPSTISMAFKTPKDREDAANLMMTLQFTGMSFDADAVETPGYIVITLR